MINGTPLYCTICKDNICGDLGKDAPIDDQNKTIDPGHHPWWVKQHCTLDPKAVNQFLLYFPYVLLIVAILLYLIETAFTSFFKANKELEAFHNLLVQESILENETKTDHVDGGGDEKSVTNYNDDENENG